MTCLSARKSRIVCHISHRWEVSSFLDFGTPKSLKMDTSHERNRKPYSVAGVKGSWSSGSDRRSIGGHNDTIPTTQRLPASEHPTVYFLCCAHMSRPGHFGGLRS